MVSVVIRFSLVQLQTPDDMRGRVSAVNALFIGTSNQLGEFESGAVAGDCAAAPDHHRGDGAKQGGTRRDCDPPSFAASSTSPAVSQPTEVSYC